jgi:uncharacterized damage-inducible protein DinB
MLMGRGTAPSGFREEDKVYQSLKEFVDGWAYESGATLKLLRALTDASLAQAVGPAGRTLGRLAWHVTSSVAEMGGHMGLDVRTPSQGEDVVPPRAADIADAYEAASASFVEALRRQWTDDMLAGMIPMYGEQWSRGMALGVLILHQCHHRGQMTVLMRQAGLPVAGVYGPSKEEWAAMGMEAQA